MRRSSIALLSSFCLMGSLLSGCNGTAPSGNPPTTASSFSDVQHVVVIYQENWSFDAQYGSFPGASGVGLGTSVNQVNVNGTPLTSLPQALDYNGNPDSRFPKSLPVKTYDTSSYVSPSGTTGDLVHRFYHEQLQIDGGKMDKFVAWSDNPGLVLSQYNLVALNLPEVQLAGQFTLGDHMFHSAFGGSFLNHQYLICACAPRWPNAPANYISNPDPAHLNDNKVTPDGYAVNTAYTVYNPHPSGIATSNLVPPQTAPTIGDRLSAANISWKWYSGGWNNALAGNPDPNFQFHHQPFAYYKNFADGTAAKAAHLQDEQNFLADVNNGNLPAVSFIKPIGENNEHPGYASILAGQQHVVSLVNAIKNSKYWNNTVIIITFDENGGRWDSVAPPVIDRWGPGTRVPLIIVSPLAKKYFVDHTQYETDSILAFIEKRFNLKPLGSRDAAANPFSNAFTFSIP